jgi:hypothetical protein
MREEEGNAAIMSLEADDEEASTAVGCGGERSCGERRGAVDGEWRRESIASVEEDEE